MAQRLTLFAVCFFLMGCGSDTPSSPSFPSATTTTVGPLPIPVGPYSISGVVRSQSTHAPLGAVVQLSVLNASAPGGVRITDESGNYSFEGLFPGPVILNFAALGFEVMQQRLSIDGNVHLDVALTSAQPLAVSATP